MNEKKRITKPPKSESSYENATFESAYEKAGRWYDRMTQYAFLPLGGELHCRRQFVSWLQAAPGHKVLSLCCGTGTTEQVLVETIPDIHIIALDLGVGQIDVAHRKISSDRVDLRVGDASATMLPNAEFDRVMIVMALHEMMASLRLSILCEAVRVCKPDGRVLAIETSNTRNFVSRFVRYLWWLHWHPANPETETTRNLLARGLRNEMTQAGLEILGRYTTQPAWIEGFVGQPVRTA